MGSQLTFYQVVVLAVTALAWTARAVGEFRKEHEVARLKKPKFHLTWPAGSELSDDEVEIWIGSLTVDEFHEGLRLGALASKSDKVSDALVESDHRMNELFVDRLQEWNLTDDDDVPLPPTMQTIKGLPNRNMAIMVRAWFEAMNNVPTTSSSSSNGSRLSEEQSLGLGTS
jgi:hypothetical protein